MEMVTITTNTNTDRQICKQWFLRYFVTKADKVDANVKRAIGFVEQAGAQKVIVTSAYQNEGVATLLDWLDDTKEVVHDDAYL